MMFKRDNDDDSGGPSPQHQQPLPWLRVKDVAALLLESPANLHDSRGFFFFFLQKIEALCDLIKPQKLKSRFGYARSFCSG